MSSFLFVWQGVEGFSYTYYEDLSPDDVIKIVDTLKSGGKPKVCTGCERGVGETQANTLPFYRFCVSVNIWLDGFPAQLLAGRLPAPHQGRARWRHDCRQVGPVHWHDDPDGGAARPVLP